MKHILQQLVEGKDLSYDDASHAFSLLLAGDISEVMPESGARSDARSGNCRLFWQC